MRLFWLFAPRADDHAGPWRSVAEAVEFSDGRCVLRFRRGERHDAFSQLDFLEFLKLEAWVKDNGLQLWELEGPVGGGT